MYVLLHHDPEVDTVTPVAVSESKDSLKAAAAYDVERESLEWEDDHDDCENAAAGVYVYYSISPIEVV